MEAIDRVKIECEPLPAVWADHDRLEQVLVNLMDNALRHNAVDTIVHVAARAAGPNLVTITVADDGIGLPDEIDEASGRRGDRRTATAGAGLGLSITRAIVAAHGGTLRLERPARGTCWHIDLPVAARDDDGEPAALVTPDG